MRRSEEAFDPAASWSGPDQDAMLERHDDAASLLQALERLSPKLREVFVLYEIEEMPMLDVARTLGCPRFTAYTRLHAARAALRQHLAHPDAARRAKPKRGRS